MKKVKNYIQIKVNVDEFTFKKVVMMSKDKDESMSKLVRECIINNLIKQQQ